MFLGTCHIACLESIKHFDLIREQYNPRWNANQPFVRAVHKYKLDTVITHLSGLEVSECVDQSALIHLLLSSLFSCFQRQTWYVMHTGGRRRQFM